MASGSSRTPFISRFLDRLGCRAITILGHIGDIWFLLTEVLGWILRSFANRKVRLGRVAITSQIVRIGFNSVFIVTLVSSAVGAILALQMAPPLDELGQVSLVPNIIAVAVFRELGPLIAAIVLTGFAGAAIAAELGTMVVGEEVEALEAHALNPVRFLVVPRVIAAVISLVCLATLSGVVGVLAGGVVGSTALGIPWTAYYENVVGQVGPVDFLTGLMKSVIFGLLIAIIACSNGLRVTGGAAGVGRATTATVVEGIVAIIFADLFFTAVFYATGLV